MPKAEEGRSQTTFSMNIDLHETAPDRPQRTGTNSTPKGPKSPSPPLISECHSYTNWRKNSFLFSFRFRSPYLLLSERNGFYYNRCIFKILKTGKRENQLKMQLIPKMVNLCILSLCQKLLIYEHPVGPSKVLFYFKILHCVAKFR